MKRTVCLLLAMVSAAWFALSACAPIDSDQEMGNTTGNAMLSAIAAQQGGWTYYTSNAGIFRTKDFRNFERINESLGSCLNACGGWVYYTKRVMVQTSSMSSESRMILCKMRPDGAQDQQIGTDYVTTLLVVGDWIYYQRHMDGYLCCMKIDGSEQKIITNFRCQVPVVDGEWRYAFALEGEKGLYRFAADGSDLRRVSDVDGSCAASWDGELYFINRDDDHRIYKMKPDGTNLQPASEQRASFMQVHDGWAYFWDVTQGADSSLMRVRLTNGETQSLSEPNAMTMAIVGDEMIFARMGVSGIQHARMRLDGSDMHLLP